MTIQAWTLEPVGHELHILVDHNAAFAGTDDRLLFGSSVAVFIALGYGLEKRRKLVCIVAMCF